MNMMRISLPTESNDCSRLATIYKPSLPSFFSGTRLDILERRSEKENKFLLQNFPSLFLKRFAVLLTVRKIFSVSFQRSSSTQRLKTLERNRDGFRDYLLSSCSKSGRLIMDKELTLMCKSRDMEKCLNYKVLKTIGNGDRECVFWKESLEWADMAHTHYK
jgi:hypothetical protein